MFWDKPLDLVAIGDITIDAFIRLKDAHVNCNIRTEACEICLRFADKVPYESLTIVAGVGNSANASVAASRLGLRSALVCSVGDDQNGKLCTDVLKKAGVSTAFVRVDRTLPTNYHFVLSYEAERTILIKHQPFSYALPTGKPPRWIYLSSLHEESLPFHLKLAEYLDNNPGVKLAFQPGTFQMRLGAEKLRGLYKRTEVFFCNKEEAQRITGLQSTDIKELFRALHALGPKIVCITDGPKGAYASDGSKAHFIPMYPDPKPPQNRTGAGDAFSSTFTSALILGKSIEEALRWGPVNSMSVVQKIGAQTGLLTRPELEKLLEAAPSDYRVTELY